MSVSIEVRYRHVAWWVVVWALAVTPLLCHVVHVSLERLAGSVLGSWDSISEPYSAVKARFTIAVGGVLLLLSLRPRLPAFTFGRVFLAGALAMVLVATLKSDYPTLAWWGFPGSYMGAVAVAGLFMIAWATARGVAAGFSPWKLIWVLGLAAVPLSLGGLLQYYGVEPMTTAVGRFLLVGGDFAVQGRKIPVVASTLYNSDYVGVYVALLLPLLWALVFRQAKAAPRWKFWLAVALNGAVFALGLASQCRAGVYASVLGSAFVVLCAWRRRELMPTLKVLAGLYLLIAIFMDLSRPTADLFGWYRSVWHKYVPALVPSPEENAALYSSGGAVIYRPDGSAGVILTATEQGIDVRDGAWNSVAFTGGGTGGAFFTDSSTGKTWKLAAGHASSELSVTYDTVSPVVVVPTPEGVKFSAWGKALYDVPAQSHDWCFNDARFSGRGHIWCQAIPLLSRSRFVGMGLDTFAVNYEQRDFQYKLRRMGAFDIIIDKPHSFYLQFWIGAGLLGLTYFFVGLGFSVAPTVRALPAPLAAGLVGSLLAFFVAATFNDLYIGVAPLFAGVCGMASGLGRRLT